MAYQSFEDLQVWQRSCDLTVEICQELEDCRNYTSRDQMQRAALSVPSNIAEGSERDSKGDFIRFLRIAKGSAGELRTQAYIAKRLNLISSGKADSYVKETKEIGAMLQGLIRSMQSST